MGHSNLGRPIPSMRSQGRRVSGRYRDNSSVGRVSEKCKLISSVKPCRGFLKLASTYLSLPLLNSGRRPQNASTGRYARIDREAFLSTTRRHLPVETIADELTKRKIATPRGGRWHGRTVARLLDRLHLR